MLAIGAKSVGIKENCSRQEKGSKFCGLQKHQGSHSSSRSIISYSIETYKQTV